MPEGYPRLQDLHVYSHVCAYVRVRGAVTRVYTRTVGLWSGCFLPNGACTISFRLFVDVLETN